MIGNNADGDPDNNNPDDNADPAYWCSDLTAVIPSTECTSSWFLLT